MQVIEWVFIPRIQKNVVTGDYLLFYNIGRERKFIVILPKKF